MPHKMVRRLIAVCALFALMAVGAAAASSESGGADGHVIAFFEGFDNVGVARLPQGWAGEGQVVSDAWEGEGSLLIVDDSADIYAGVRSPMVSVSAQQEYTASVWTKTDSLTGRGFVAVLIEEYNEQGQRVAFHWFDAERTLDWSKSSLDFTTTPQTDRIRFIAYATARGTVEATGRAWFDALTLVETGGSGSMNGGAQERAQTISGVKWIMPAYLKPDLDLEHPRVFTRDTNFDMPLPTGNIRWMTVSDDEIRELVPKPGSYYIYGLGGVCPTDNSRLQPIGWHEPGKVRCANGDVFPNEEYPDDGNGWRAPDGTVYYFVGRWNSFVVSEMTAALEPLAYMYVRTGDVAYAHKAAVIFDALATVYPTAIEGPLDYPGLAPGKEGGRLDRPYYQVTRSLVKYVNALDLIWNSGVLDEVSATNPELTMKENIVYNLILNGADYAYRTVQQPGYGDRLHNGTADFNNGILAAGSLLGIDEYIEWVVNGPTSIGNMIANNVDRDGNYFETSPSYADHTRRLYLDIAETLYHLRTPKYPEGINLYDDPRFQRFYIGIKEKNTLAGRVALYGDAGPDRAIVYERPFDQEEFQWALLFYARVSSPEVRAEIAQHLADMAGGDPNRRLLAGRQYLFRVDRITEYDPGAIQPTTRPSELLGGKGIAMLRSGQGRNQRGALLRYGATLNHGQRDEMGINFFAAGRELSNDPGYDNGHYRAGWTRRTVSHITTVVDETSQLTSDSPGGSLNVFSTAPGYSVVDASNELAYEQTDLYRRTLAMIDTSPTDSYLVDIFRVRGGKVRDYSFHGLGTVLETEGLNLSDPAEGSLASPDYCWGDKIRSDGFLIPHANQGFYWTPPPGNSGYGFLCNPRRAEVDGLWQASWTDRPGGGLGVRLTMLPQEGREVIVARGPSPMSYVPYVLVRDRGDTASQYAGVIDLGTGSFQVDTVEPLSVQGPSAGDLSPIAFVATLAEHRGAPAKDYIMSTLANEPFTASHNGAEFRTDAEFAFVRIEEGAFPTIRMEKGSLLETPDVSVALSTSAYEGTIIDVDYETPSLIVSTPLPLGDALKGRHVLIDADEYSHNSPYVIDRVEVVDEGYRIYLSDPTLVLAQGLVRGSPKDGVVPSTVDLPYSRNVLSGANRYFDGKLLVSENGASSVIQRIAANFADYVVDNAEAFSEGEVLYVYDAKPGDRFSVPAYVHLDENADGTFQLNAPEPVWMHLPDSVEAIFYFTRESGRYEQAPVEVRDGKRWYLMVPGQILLKRIGHWVPQEADASEIRLGLIDPAEGAGIPGATLRALIDEKEITFVETRAGEYLGSIPAGTRVGVHTVTVEAAKDGVHIPPLTLDVKVSVPWQVDAPARVEVPLGQEAEVRAMLVWEGLAQPGVQLALVDRDGQRLVMEQAGESEYVVSLPPVYRGERFELVSTRPDGFARSQTVEVVPVGGKILPAHEVLRTAARQDFVIEARFVDAQGNVVSGDALPADARAIVGFAFVDFEAVDGSDTMTASMRGLAAGTHRVRLMATGYGPVDIQVISEDQ